MLELILILTVAMLVLPLITLVFQPPSTDFHTKQIRFWSIIVIVITLILLIYFVFFAGPVIHFPQWNASPAR